jgi:hypothetical protein
MMEGVGRRLGKSGFLLDIGTASLNGREHNVLFRNDGDQRFTEVGWINGAGRVEDARGVAILDVDGNGKLDILLRNYATPAALLKNRARSGQWVGFELIGTDSNRDAVGARIRLRSGGKWQTRVVTAGSGYLSGSSLRQHFGLGESTRIDEVAIEWPSGHRTVLRDLAAGRLHRLTEGTPTEGFQAAVSP